MELDMFIEMFYELKVKDFYVKNIIMDNDVIIIVRVKVIFDLFF